MDPRRILILTSAAVGLAACAAGQGAAPSPTALTGPAQSGLAAGLTVGPVPNLEEDAASSSGPPNEAIAGAHAQPAAGLEEDAVIGAVQVFAWAPGRLYPVRTAPLRVTTLTLGADEVLVSKAAGDTVRWQIAETSSGQGAAQRSHVLIKPLQRGLQTNLVLTTNRRVYLIDLSSGAADRFNAAVAWDLGALDPEVLASGAPSSPTNASDPVTQPFGPIDTRYRIEPQGRPPRWTPVSVFNDGVRTFVAFDPGLRIVEAPALFVVAADGARQMVNYRQADGLFIVDQIFDRAELRLGDRRPQVVRLSRLGGGQ